MEVASTFGAESSGRTAKYITVLKKPHETSCSPWMGIWNFLLSKVCGITVRAWEYQKLLKNMEKKLLSTLLGERVGSLKLIQLLVSCNLILSVISCREHKLPKPKLDSNLQPTHCTANLNDCFH